MSTNGGESWNIGALVDGEMITKILNTIGLNADWINTGAFVVKDSRGNIVFRADTATGRVDIVADSFLLKGNTIDEITQNKLNTFINNVYTPEIESIQAQVDGQVETFYYDYEPTLQNIPASQWTTETDRQKHMGDLFFLEVKRIFLSLSERWLYLEVAAGKRHGCNEGSGRCSRCIGHS